VVLTFKDSRVADLDSFGLEIGVAELREFRVTFVDLGIGGDSFWRLEVRREPERSRDSEETGQDRK
jgi:hypothetical protein